MYLQASGLSTKKKQVLLFAKLVLEKTINFRTKLYIVGGYLAEQFLRKQIITQNPANVCRREFSFQRLS